jgi:hypothetical protein
MSESGLADQLDCAGCPGQTTGCSIVDRRNVNFLGVAGLRLLLTIGEERAKADRRWALITRDAGEPHSARRRLPARPPGRELDDPGSTPHHARSRRRPISSDQPAEMNAMPAVDGMGH